MKLVQVTGEFAIGRYEPSKALPPLKSLRFCSITRTPTELSLVTESEYLPDGYEQREDGWACLQVEGILDFSLTGILAQISGSLAGAQISLFAVSTYDTDYVLVKQNTLDRAKKALQDAGIEIG